MAGTTHHVPSAIQSAAPVSAERSEVHGQERHAVAVRAPKQRPKRRGRDDAVQWAPRRGDRGHRTCIPGPVGIADLRHEYETHGLDEADLAPNPLDQWRRWYDDAVAAGCTEPNAMTLATVDAGGRPNARMVLVRGVDERGLWFFTNTASAKATELASQPAAALVFGWLELHRQVRVRGPVETMTRAEVEAYFASRPRLSQLASWASRQSAVLADRATLLAELADVEARFPGEVPAPEWVGSYRVVAAEVEFWQGRSGRLHDRLRYRRDGAAWVVERLYP